MPVIIRDEGPADIAAIHRVVEAAFRQSVEADLVDRLRADGDSVISLVAEEDGKIVGHILFSPMSAPFPALGLAPVSVLPERQHAGIGSKLIREGLKRAEREGCRAVFVLGEPEYYRRFGFDPALAAGFASAYAGPYLMALPLNGEMPAEKGGIDYAPAFAALG
ncbi:N-acetyltransferase [Phyllobacterium phragmitis]|uniref:N-acetyltransferase n=1 Tax=Phyllobacterium phragmitis TaxID=2670329 RepID=A0A2S9IMR8_9HYPH|nr:N-acetyltransferase [Phyllobacterium phragmitis]PRD41816.1 N-acetyltransferase [Phyllobacterium phragmitis]